MARWKRPGSVRHANACEGGIGAPAVTLQPLRVRAHRNAGFTLLELVFAVAVTAVLAWLAIGQFNKTVERSRSASAVADISIMAVEIERFRSLNRDALPANLAAIGRGAFLDPWERPYLYTNLTVGNGKGSARKDHRLNPINSEYDLFSAGPNGVFKPQVSQKDSLDDVMRARDGAFIGIAKDF